ncbi:MAG: DUF1449 family protein [Planctomycetota bacterium]|nr:DUF1449 family protein [Planctomycetota bacterium]
MTAELLSSWWNLIFIVPFLLAMLCLGVFVVSGAGAGDTDASADIAADADIDADAEAGGDPGADGGADGDADADAEPDGDGDGDTDADADADASETPLYLAALSWIGVGRLPLSLLVMAMLMGWGMIGFCTNYLLWPRFHERGREAFLPLISLPLATVGSVLWTVGLSRIMGRFFPLSETYAKRRHELLGLVGEALYTINHDFGMAFIRDDRGEVFQVPCRVGKNDGEIPKGAKVRLVAYNGKRQIFYVQPCDVARDPAVKT